MGLTHIRKVMMIRIENIEGVLDQLKDTMRYADRIMLMKGEEITVDKLSYPSLRTCSGHEDEQIFRGGEVDPDSYHAFMLEPVFELLNAIIKGKILPKEFEDSSVIDRECIIDLGAMLDKSEGKYRRQLGSKDETGQPPKTRTPGLSFKTETQIRPLILFVQGFIQSAVWLWKNVGYIWSASAAEGLRRI